MNCSQARNRVLTVSHPRKASEDVREHVRACAKCQAWVKGAMEVESALRHLPIPPAPQNKKSELLKKFRTPEVVVPSERNEPLPLPPRKRETFWTRFGVGVTIAASVLAMVTWMGQRSRRPETPIIAAQPMDDLLANLMKRHVTLASGADNASKRLDGLNQLAADLLKEGKDFAFIASDEDMKALARMYSKVVEQGIMKQAEMVRGPQQRKILESVQQQLQESGEAVAKLAERAKSGSIEPLRQMAEASRKGDQHIRTLLREDAS